MTFRTLGRYGLYTPKIRSIVYSWLSLLVVHSSEATTYYIDYVNGSDANIGTSMASPWKHSPFDRQATGTPKTKTLTAGDSVLFKGGVVYRGALEIDGRVNSGTDGNPITLKGDGWGTGKALFDGSEEITTPFIKCPSASACGDNPAWNSIYYSDLGSGRVFNRGYYEDGEFLWPAQDPNPADPYLNDDQASLRVIPQDSPTVKHTRTSITDPRYLTQSDPAFWNGAYVIVWRVPNVMSIKKVISFNPATHTVVHEDLGGDIYTDRDSYYSMLNHVSMIDKPAEYSLDEASGRFYVWPRGGTPTGHQYTIGKYDSAIFASSVKHFVIEGFSIQRYASAIQAIDGGSGTAAEHVWIRNNDIRTLTSNGWYAIQAVGNNMTVENNLVSDAKRAVGILAGGTQLLIQNNTIRRATRQGIWFMGATDGRIVGNTVSEIMGTHANSISVYLNSRNILVANNRVTGSVRPLTYQQSHNLFVVNNLFIQDPSFKESYAVAGWSAMTGTVLFSGNVIQNGSFLDQSGVNATVIHKNNVIEGGGCNTGCLRDHNVYTKLSWWQSAANNWALGPHELIATDLSRLFVNASVGDYRLNNASPALDTGTDPASVFPASLFPGFSIYKDIANTSRPQGSAWDIGAYEYCASGSCSSTFSSCDVNSDHSINVADVQTVVLQAIGISPCVNDINQDHVCNVVDVQRVVIAALGGECNK